MKKLINHIKIWNRWRKQNTNSKLHKFLVLIGFIKSPTFYLACVEVPSIEEILKDNDMKFVYDKGNDELVAYVEKLKSMIYSSYGIPEKVINEFCEAGHVYPVTTDELRDILKKSQEKKLDAFDDYIKTTKDYCGGGGNKGGSSNK